MQTLRAAIAAISMVLALISAFLGLVLPELPKLPYRGEVLQGDLITVSHPDDDYETHCTIGYIDGDKLLTAGHCIDPGQTVYYQGRELGQTIQNPYISNAENIDGDWAVVQLPPGTYGNNHITGNQRWEISSVPVGETVCYYARQTDETTCITVRETYPNSLMTDYHDTPIIKGDSGSPAWVPGEGYIGSVTTKTYTGSIGITGQPN